jgi:hypothetical protein
MAVVGTHLRKPSASMRGQLARDIKRAARMSVRERMEMALKLGRLGRHVQQLAKRGNVGDRSTNTRPR